MNEGQFYALPQSPNLQTIIDGGGEWTNISNRKMFP
jgi:hypothetical protein